MALPRTASTSSQPTPFPPLPVSGPPEDSEFAQQNFKERELLARPWFTRLIPRLGARKSVTPLKRRLNLRIYNEEEENDGVIASPTDAQSAAALERAEEIDIAPSSESADEQPSKEEHLYQWAMVYENQRGISFMSSRRYSSRSLLPNDPPAFTIVTPGPSLKDDCPTKGSRKSQRSCVSLDEYPLPDGNWRWASKEWMIDMRDGTVQYDGFEYNWLFWSRHWRSKAGALNAGAWVRRRRWVRLMERPPLSILEQEAGVPDDHVQEVKDTLDLELKDIWQGNEGDWPRLHHVLKLVTRDGRKLELWRDWIGTEKHHKGSKLLHKQWSGDDSYLPSEVARDALAQSKSEGKLQVVRPELEFIDAVLRSHGEDIILSFVYPDSRVQFLKLVIDAGLSVPVNPCQKMLGVSESDMDTVVRVETAHSSTDGADT